jgi:hypothetical protein
MLGCFGLTKDVKMISLLCTLKFPGHFKVPTYVGLVYALLYDYIKGKASIELYAKSA